MSDIQIEVVTNIEGLDELERDFTEGSKRAVKKFLGKVEREAAKVLIDSAENMAPRDTGHLADSIGKSVVQSDGALTVRVGPNRSAFYGLIQEFGAPEANIPALHWLEDSAKAVKDQVLDKYVESINTGLEDMKG
jgi:HK97 gp10 family phage protein